MVELYTSGIVWILILQKQLLLYNLLIKIYYNSGNKRCNRSFNCFTVVNTLRKILAINKKL